MNILGLNLFHADTSACLIIKDEIVAAAEEERFSRIKHYSGFPIRIIKFCLKSAGLSLKDIDVISTNFNRKHNLFEKLTYASQHLKNINIYKRIMTGQKEEA